MWPLAVAAGGILAQYIGQQETNRSNEAMAGQATAANMEEAARNREFQAQQASAQQAFQERMSNTSYQRAMADMKEAGINPLMAAKGGGASTPSGASGGGSQGSAVAAKNENPFAGFGTLGGTAMDALRLAGDLKQQAAQTDYIRTQNAVAKKGIPEAEIKNEVYDWVKKKVNQMQQFRSEVEKQDWSLPSLKDKYKKGRQEYLKMQKP